MTHFTGELEGRMWRHPALVRSVMVLLLLGATSVVLALTACGSQPSAQTELTVDPQTVDVLTTGNPDTVELTGKVKNVGTHTWDQVMVRVQGIDDYSGDHKVLVTKIVSIESDLLAPGESSTFSVIVEDTDSSIGDCTAQVESASIHK